MGKIITIDVGNSNVVAAALEQGNVVFMERFKTHDNWIKNTVKDELRRILEKHGLEKEDIEGSIISSVVPEMNPLLTQALRKLTGKAPLLVSPTLHTGLKVRDYDLSCLGMDRVVDMTAAKAYYPCPLMVVDMGTCTTTSVIDDEGYFIGGLISAGIQLSLDAEAEHTAQLPALWADGAETLIGNDTVSNMISGAVIGTAAMIDGIAERVQAQICREGEALNVVLTGGLSNQILPWLKNEVHYEPELLLKGLELIYRKNAAAPSEKTE